MQFCTLLLTDNKHCSHSHFVVVTYFSVFAKFYQKNSQANHFTLIIIQIISVHVQMLQFLYQELNDHRENLLMIRTVSTVFK